MQYNKKHGITPETIVKTIQKKMVPGQVEDGKKLAAARLRDRLEEIRRVYCMWN